MNAADEEGHVLRDTLGASAIAGTVLSALALAAWGWTGAAGSAIGVGVASLEISAMALLGTMLLGMPAGPRVVRLTLLYALLKLPIVASAVFLAVRLGWASLDCFLAGFTLVYLRLVFVGLRQFRTQKRDLFS
jgi:hypothetical protein